MHHAFETGLNVIHRGEDNMFATSTEEQARKICELLSNGDNRPYAKIGEEVGVSELVVVQIATGRTWRHISESYGLTYQKRNSRFTEEDIHEICKIFVQCKGMDFIDIIHIVADELNFEYCANYRHKMRFIYFKRPGYFTRITNQYDYVPQKYKSQLLS